MIHKLRNRIEEEKGFTLIELLVVILIIGILAAIAIPSFLNQRGKGQDAAAKSSARTAQTAEETCATDNNGSYVNCNLTALKAIEATLTGGPVDNAAGVTNLSATGYTVTGTSASSKTFSITRNSDGSITRGGTGGSW